MLTNRMIGIYLILNELQGKFSIKELDDRIFAQKAIYLLQVLGGKATDLKYRYNWYHYGPYCPSLADHIYEIERFVEDSSHKKDKEQVDKLRLNDDYRRELSNLKKLIDERPKGIEKTKWVELLCSIHFIKKIAFTGEPVTKDNFLEWLKKFKKAFDDSLARFAWDVLEKKTLI